MGRLEKDEHSNVSQFVVSEAYYTFRIYINDVEFEYKKIIDQVIQFFALHLFIFLAVQENFALNDQPCLDFSLLTRKTGWPVGTLHCPRL